MAYEEVQYIYLHWLDALKSGELSSVKEILQICDENKTEQLLNGTKQQVTLEKLPTMTFQITKS